MSVDPFPGGPDPAWDAFTAAHQEPPEPTGAPAAPRVGELDIQALTAALVAAQRVVKDAAPEPAQHTGKVPDWAKSDTAKTSYWTVAVPTLVTGCANIAVHAYGTLWPSLCGGAATVVGVVAGIAGMNRAWPQGFNSVVLGLAVGGITWTTAATGSGWIDVFAWLGGTAAALGFKLMYEHNNAAHRLDLEGKREDIRLKQARVRTEVFRGDAIAAQSQVKAAVELARLQGLMQQEQAPYLGGVTSEEAAIRKAVWEVHEEQLLTCDVTPTRTGWTAVVGLPSQLSRKDARASWDRVASAMKLDGRMKCADGRRTNELVISFVDNAKTGLESLTGWYPGIAGIGVYLDTGEVVDVPVEGVHSMTGGRTNLGKSAYARIQLMRTVTDPLRAGIVIDPKRSEAVAWAGKLRTAGEAADLEEREQQIYDMLCELMAEFRHRQTLFPGLYWEASEDYPTLFITIDEGAALKRMSTKPQFKDALDIAETLYGEARVVGMYFNWASQYLAKGTSIPQLVKENVGAVIGLTTAGAEGDRMLFGEEAGQKGWTPSDLCKGIPGRALVKYLDSEPEPVQLWHVTGEHIADLPDAEPWRSKVYRPAVTGDDLVTEAQRLRDAGMSVREVAEVVGQSKSWVSARTTAA